jgi:hypothetical protein
MTTRQCLDQATNLASSGKLLEAAALAREICTGGLDLGCELDGVIAVHQKDLPRARVWLGRFCDKGSASDCQLLAGLELEHGDRVQAAALMKKACQGGIQETCEDAKKLEAASTVPAQVAERFSQLRKIADPTIPAGEAEFLNAELLKFDGDIAAGLLHLDGRCARDHALACSYLGDRAARTESRIQYKRKACDLGLASACGALMYDLFRETGSGAMAEAALSKACGLGGAEVCKGWTAFLDFLKGVAAQTQVARESTKAPGRAPTSGGKKKKPGKR